MFGNSDVVRKNYMLITVKGTKQDNLVKASKAISSGSV